MKISQVFVAVRLTASYGGEVVSQAAWAWGAYSAGDQIMQNNQRTRGIQFQQGAKAGSRLHSFR